MAHVRVAVEKELPSGWRRARLSDVVRQAQPGFASGKRDPSGVVQLRMNNVTASGRLDWSLPTRVPVGAGDVEAFRLEPGDVLFNNTNSVELVGKSALFEGFGEPVVFSNHFTRLRTDGEKLAPEFLAAWLLERWQAGLFRNICHRWVGQAAVQRERLLELEIPLPNIPEQKRIAATLKKQMAAIERARASAAMQLRAAQALPAAYLRAIFTSREAQRWPRRALGDASEIVSGITLGRQPRGSLARSVPYLRVANVKDGYLDLSDVYKIEATEAEIGRLRLRSGDLLLTEGGDLDKLGRGTVWRDELPECLHQNHIFRVRFDMNQFVPDFVSAQIGSQYGKAYFLAHGKRTTGIATINQRVLAAFPLMAPERSEQERIVNTLHAQQVRVERMRHALAARLTEIDAISGVLLRRAFNGDL